MKSNNRKFPLWGMLLALTCVFAVTNVAEAKTAHKKQATNKATVAQPASIVLGRANKPKSPEFYGYPRPRTQNPREYYINGNVPNAAYYGNTYGYSYGQRTSAYPNSSYSQQASPEYLMKYSQYVQQYNRSNDMPQPYGFAPNTYPASRYQNISQQERFERDRVYSAQVALHALLLRYGTREGGERFPDREKLTQEAIRYADLLRYGMTHTYTNPETNIAP